jgi:hypothetical protein
MPFRHPNDPEELRREMRREDVTIAILAALCAIAIPLAAYFIWTSR